MNKYRFLGSIKITVAIGYLILFALALFGLYQLNKQLVTFSKSQDPLAERKELSLVSNALLALYEAESTRKVILTDDIISPNLFSSFEKQYSKINLLLDTLYNISTDKEMHLRLDTVRVLLEDKNKNLNAMIALKELINNLPHSEIITSKTFTKKDMDDIDKLMQERLLQMRDTSYYIREKKSFVDRLKAVFSSKEDSLRVVSKGGVEVVDSMPTDAKILTDTLVRIINTASQIDNEKKAKYMVRLSQRQNSMLYYDELLTMQINTILRGIEAAEQRIVDEMNKERAVILKRSSKIVSGIAFSSLVVLIIFFSLTLYLTNRNQRYREALEISNKNAQMLLKARERFMLMMSHDVRAPLSSIIGHIEYIMNENLLAEEKVHLESIRSSSEQILDLSNRLMDYHRLEQGKSEVRLVPFLPYKVLNATYNSFIPVAKKKHLHIEAELDLDETAVYEGDPFIIRQIVNNLVNNAIKFTHEGGVYLKSSMDEKTETLKISVRDTGVGISVEEKSRIFEDFERGGSADDKQSIEGFGLGLPITKKLVDLLGGSIDYETEIGKGTEFFLTIPLRKLSDAQITEVESLHVASEVGTQTARVLMVDDDATILNVYTKLLEKQGFEVITTDDSSKVFELIENNDFDIIFTDIQMPGMNGFELVKKIRNSSGKNAQIPIIALSARSDVSEKDFKAAGFTSFIAKPIPFDLMAKIVRQAVECNASYATDLAKGSPQKTGGVYSLIEFVKDDKETSLDILRTFYEDTNNKLASLENALETDDWEEVKSVAHKFLPMMNIINEKELVRISEKLDQGEKNREYVQTLIASLHKVNKEVEKVIEELQG